MSLSTVEIRIASANPSLVELQATGSPAIVQINMGPAGAAGAAGASGGSTNAWDYKAKTNATSGYPTDGHLIWNNATQTSATSIIVSHLTDDDTDIELFLSFFVLNQKIFIQNRDDSSQNQVWQITGTPTVTGANTSTAYYTFPVTLVSSAGAAFTNNHSILFGQIVVATNAVTSATTSDGTCELDIESLTLNTCNSDFIFLADGAYDIGTGSNYVRTAYINTVFSGALTVGYNSSGSYLGQIIIYSDTAGSSTTLNPTTGGSGLLTLPSGTGTLALTSDITVTPTNTVTLTNKTLTSPAINSATIGTAATFNATTYTFGTGAAAALNTALGANSVDSRISSLFAVPFQFAQDNFLGRWITSTGNNALNWFLVGSASLWSDAPWIAAGFPGGTNLSTNNNAFFYYMSAAAAASIANFNGVVYDHVFSPNSFITSENIFVGLRNTASATAEVGRRGLYYEAGVDTNWQLLHETSAGVKTKVDTGKAVVAGQIVRVTIKFVSATQTDMIIATSTNTTPVTVSATSGFSCTGSVGLGFWLQSTTAANRFMLQMRATLAWPTSTL
jgi:hypothetical protein